MRELSIKLGQKVNTLKKYFSLQPQIAAVYIFGSFGTPYEHPFSDIDFGVIFKSHSVPLSEEMMISVSITDILGIENVDLVNLRKSPLSLQYKAVSEGELIFEGDYKEHSNFLERVYKRYLDYLPDLEAYEREYEKALKEAYLGDG